MTTTTAYYTTPTDERNPNMITKNQVKDLRTEAIKNGDSRLTKTCDIALASRVVLTDGVVSIEPPESAFAWLDCVNAIRDLH